MLWQKVTELQLERYVGKPLECDLSGSPRSSGECFVWDANGVYEDTFLQGGIALAAVRVNGAGHTGTDCTKGVRNI